VNVLLVGLGGNGSKLLVSLARAALALRAMGRTPPHVVAVDPDRVSEANLARQAFAPQDVGRPKAEVLVGKVNLLYGLGWEWRTRPFQPEDLRGAEVVVSALDSRRARRQVAEALEKRKVELWWVDLGNGDRYGQVLAGDGTKEAPWPHQRLPELIGEEEDEGPSCSVLEALLRQDLLVNDMAAVWAAEILWHLLRGKRPPYLGVFYDLDRGKTTPVLWREARTTEGLLAMGAEVEGAGGRESYPGSGGE